MRFCSGEEVAISCSKEGDQVMYDEVFLMTSKGPVTSASDELKVRSIEELSQLCTGPGGKDWVGAPYSLDPMATHRLTARPISTPPPAP